MRPGAAVRGPTWSEPIRVHSVERAGPYVRVMGCYTESRNAVDCILTQADVEQLEVVDGPNDMAGSPQRAFLAAEVMRYRFASADDPLYALHASAADPLPHQIEAVYNYALRWPRVRFMLAHEAGAGKTVMAGLIIKELKARRAVSGALVVAPTHLHEHWRRELGERLGESSRIADRDPRHHIRWAWNGPGITIASAGFIEREDVMPYLESSPPDIIIVDEAHDLPLRPSLGGGRRSLAASLHDMSEHLLFLTPTPPPEGSPDLRLLLDMLEPGFLADPQMTQESTAAADNPLFLRRTAETLTDSEGSPLFGSRRVETVPVTSSEIEALLYGAVGDYVRKRSGRAGPDATLHISRCMASGVYAALRALEARMRSLEDALRDYAGPEQAGPAPAVEREDAEAEIKSLDRLIMMARRVLDSDSERKVLALRQVLQGLGGAQALVVTESADTLHYLEDRIRSWGYGVCTLHDKMEYGDRVRAEAAFRGGADVMVATDAVGEGINVQFCSNMINYDLPWEPGRAARRLAYLRRYGNSSDISILNMLVADTPEGRVMKGLLDCVDSIRDEAGNDRILDYIGMALPGGTFRAMMGDAATGARDPDAISEDLNVRVAEWYHNDGRRAISDGLVARPMDTAALSLMAEDSRTHKASPEYTADMLSRALDMLGGRVRRRPDGLDAIDFIPPELRRSAPAMPDSYPKITFDPSRGTDAELVAPGHPIFEAVVGWISDNCAGDAGRGAVFTDPDGMMDGYVLFHELEVRDGAGAVAGRRLVSHFVDSNAGKITHHHPSILWDLQPGGEDPAEGSLHAAEARATQAVFGAAERYRDELLMERRRQADVRERYGLASLDGLIRDVADTMERAGDPDGVARAAEQKARYGGYRQDLLARISREQELSMSAPRLACWVRVVPGAAEPADPRAHASGIRAAMEYERRHDRLPVDVSGRSMGYDIESRDAEGRAIYIAVRAREGAGGVSITPNEMRVARNAGPNYYLYVAYGDSLARVRDPGHMLAARRNDIRHAISADEIRAHAEP